VGTHSQWTNAAPNRLHFGKLVRAPHPDPRPFLPSFFLAAEL
jgi:hypothetical protein